MQIDYQLLWDTRPTNIPGKITKILPNGRGFIEIKIPLRYLDGNVLDEVTCGQLSNFRERESVLFTIKAESPLQRRNRESNNKKIEAENVRIATEDKIEEAVNSFQGELLRVALEQATQAKSSAQETIDKYNEKLSDLYDEKRQFDDKVSQEVDQRIGPKQEELDQKRNALVLLQQDIASREAELHKQEAEIAPYKRAISLTLEQIPQVLDAELPKDLAVIWPDLLRNSGLNFRSDIATAFLLSVIASTYSGSIVLLNGSVGVGKTSLVNQSAEVLGGRCNIIPVRPAWIDPSDLVGFFDPINNTFRPTPFTTALRDATGDRLRLICLDELNLAKVENYAADLLSCIEYSRANGRENQGDSDAGKLKLYSKDIEQQLWEEAKDITELEDEATKEELRRLRTIRTLITHYPSQSPFPANAVLIGTLNSDETTYDLSPKMIDRSYVITFPPANFEPVLEEVDEKEYLKNQISVTKLVEQIHKNIGIPTKHWDVVVEWNKELQAFGIPLGHRVKRDYNVFRATGSVLGLLERDCLGYFLFCKILPRIFFFKEQSNAGAGTSETKCKNWLQKLRKEYGNFGPTHVIDAMIRMCEDERVSAVRYWSKS